MKYLCHHSGKSSLSRLHNLPRMIAMPVDQMGVQMILSTRFFKKIPKPSIATKQAQSTPPRDSILTSMIFRLKSIGCLRPLASTTFRAKREHLSLTKNTKQIYSGRTTLLVSTSEIPRNP